MLQKLNDKSKSVEIKPNFPIDFYTKKFLMIERRDKNIFRI